MRAPAPSRYLRFGSLAFRFAVGAGAVVLALGIAGSLYGTRPAPMQRPAQERIVTVRAVTLEPVPVARSWDGYGTARALDPADVAAQVAARVVERPAHVRAGAPVERGEVLVRLDATDFEQRVAWSEQQIASLEAQLEALEVESRRARDQIELAQEQEQIQRRELARLEEAVRRGGGSPGELDRLRAQVVAIQREVAGLNERLETVPPRRAQLQALLAAERANLRIAQENLERTTIRAPIAGQVQELFAEVGQMLQAGAPVARIVDLSRVEVPIRLPASARPEVAVGQPAELRAGESSGEALAWPGRVARLTPEIDPQTRTFGAFVVVEQDGGGPMLYPGQFVIARVRAAREEPRLIVPRRALDGDAVMVLDASDAAEPGLARARRIEVRPLFSLEGRFPSLDAVETQWTAVEGDLAPGQGVIVTNLDELRPGTLVRAAPAGGAEPAAEAAAPGAPPGGAG